MPRHDQTPEQIEAETDRLLLEQAQAFIRDMRATAQNAPYGKVVQNGREFARNVLQTIIQEQNDLLEKKKKPSNAPAAATENISDMPPKQS